MDLLSDETCGNQNDGSDDEDDGSGKVDVGT